ncbi:hypothetical protein JKP88DRAFT_268208 [Tribonema minus]|uniref:NADP-dependent oxidoreductase domain-containing protein n=1 Tax=Tribonema minus TaxID=303371 RepID=A0A835ZBE8_9STRA|nr:hypothetical protein JKP88DRAFT_268208 [Tribonema minus]
MRATWSKLGFGAAKCAGSPEQRAALQAALAGGINVVDTGVSFKDGSSERMVGEELRRAPHDLARSVTVVSKVGYWKEPAEGTTKQPPGALRLLPGVMYSLHPDFMARELRSSANRLGRVPSLYMVHNPESYVSCVVAREQEKLGKQMGEDGVPDAALLSDAREETYAALDALFEVLEQCSAAGSVGGYGVCSHGLSSPPSDPLHLDVERILAAARAAARRHSEGTGGGADAGVGSLAAVQLPGNLVETLGVEGGAAAAAAAAGVRVMLTRPLSVMLTTAVVSDGLQLISSLDRRGEPPQDYMDVCREVIEHFTYPPPEGREPTQEEIETMQGCQFMQQLVQDMNQQLGSFATYEHLQQELAHAIIPMINAKFDELDATSVKHLQAFLDRYGDMVTYNCAERLRDAILAAHPDGGMEPAPGDTWAQHSLRWLQARPHVDTVLVGMHQPRYVQDALAVLQR